jgi:hypothetical protein
MLTSELNPGNLIGRCPDELTAPERPVLAGKWYAVEAVSQDAFRRQVIEAVGRTVDECAEVLVDRGLDFRRYEYILMPPL